MFNIFDIIFFFANNYDMNRKAEIGNAIKNARLDCNLRMEDVARSVGITRSTLWSIENGKGNYSINTLIDLIDYFNLSLEIIRDKTTSDKKRASRINSVLDKKINRFVIMCVEQYALYKNSGSRITYNELYKKGVLKELSNDYEDMHGMSTYSINEYIEARM